MITDIMVSKIVKTQEFLTYRSETLEFFVLWDIIVIEYGYFVGGALCLT